MKLKSEDNKNSNKSFFVPKLIRDNKVENPVPETRVNPSAIIASKKKTIISETYGYHLDPSRYETLKKDFIKKEEPSRLSKIDISNDEILYNGPSNRNPVVEKPVEVTNPVVENSTDLDELKNQGVDIPEEVATPNFDYVEPTNDEINTIDDNIDFQTPMTPEEEYYAQIADKYVEYDETQIENIISEEDIAAYEQKPSYRPRTFVTPKIVETKVEPVKPQETVVQIKNEQPKPVEKPVYTPVENKVKEEVPEEVINPIETTQVSINKPSKSKVKHKYIFPSLDLLKKSSGQSEDDKELAAKQTEIINSLLQSNDINAKVAKSIFGPTVIIHFIEFADIRDDVRSIRRIESNLEMYLETQHVRLLTPIPGMRFAGIEVPRPMDQRSAIFLGDLLSSKEFKNCHAELPFACGKTNFGETIIADIFDMPHGLAAGRTKSGKSVCLNTIIVSLMYHLTPDDVRLILLDPKLVEFSKYADIPHLAMPVITEKDYFEPTMVWLVDEMERRYQILNKYGCVELPELNEVLEENHEEKIPFIVMIMDEFNDWFADASATVDKAMTRLMQKARAAGIHIILATQRPSADVIKGTIKANIAARLAFSVQSQSDSVVILGQAGADKLEGRGDMILRYAGLACDTRLQGAYVSNKEIKDVVNEVKAKNQVDYIVTLEELLQSSMARGENNGSKAPKLGRNDEIFEEVAYYVVRNQNASVNQLQKIYGTGFNKMDLIFRDLESLNIISHAQQGTKRKVLVNEFELEKILDSIKPAE